MIYTFYSYKGGVGRSMALANIAELFYREGLNVLMIDWDLEAPGLESFFMSNNEAEEVLKHRGLVEMLQDYKTFMSQPEESGDDQQFTPPPLDDLSQYYFPIYPNTKKGNLWLLPAGQRDHEYFDKYASFVRSFDWLDFYKKWGGEKFFELFRQKTEEIADIILIDSRTGLSEMGGVCTYQLADVVLMFTSTNQQSLDGVLKVAELLQSNETKAVRDQVNRPLEVVIIPSRVEDRAQVGELEDFKIDFINNIQGVGSIPSALKWDDEKDWGKFLYNLKVPHLPYFTYFEKLVLDIKQGAILKNAYTRVGSLLALLAPDTSKIKNTEIAKVPVPFEVDKSNAMDVGKGFKHPITNKKQDYLRIFIGSPGDVETERAIVYKVINDVEEILRIYKDHNVAGFVSPLRALGWEKVASNVDLPNQVILEKFPIEESDIYIFILWKRLGTPPRTPSAAGRLFSSGTEEEFIRAFEQRRKNPNGRPVIMLYRKTVDSSLIGKDDKEIEQYGKVLRFFRECEPSGKYPTLIYDFKANDFEITLRKHLLENILNLYKNFGENNIQQDEVVEEDQSARIWLEHNNLLADPFHHRFAEDEADLTKYYVRFKNLQLNADYLLNDKSSWLVFGHEGSGKTALRKFLIARRQNDPQVRCIEYFDEEIFISTLTEGQDPEKIALSISIQICEMALKNTGITSLDLRKVKNPSSAFLLLQKKLKTQGVEQILIFIDPFRKAVKDVAKVSSVLARLADVFIDGIGLRFFLPKSIYMALSNKQRSYISRCNPMEIQWEPSQLLDLIRQRLIYYSKDKRNVISSIGALSEPKGGMDKIDQAIIGLSENNPRAVIWLADKLISKHCQSEPIPLRIQRQTWDQVQEEWWSWGRNHILGLPGKEDEFWQSGSDIYFKDVKLNLSKRTKTLLGILVEAAGQICTKEKLIEAGWKNESREGISEAALRESIRRLKIELGKNNINPGWVKTVHNQGYQLQIPDSDALDQED